MPAPTAVFPSAPNHFASPATPQSAPQKKELSPMAKRRIELANQIKAAGEANDLRLKASLCIECAKLLDNGDWNNLGMLKATADMWAMAYNAMQAPQGQEVAVKQQAKEEATKRRQAAETLEAQLKLKALKV